MDDKLTEIINIQKTCTVDMSAEQVEELLRKISDATVKHLDIGQVTSAIDELKDDISKIEKSEDSSARNDIIINTLEEVKVASGSISKNVARLGRTIDDTFKDVALNSAQSLDALNKMNSNIENLVKSLVQTPVTVAQPTATKDANETATGTK